MAVHAVRRASGATRGWRRSTGPPGLGVVEDGAIAGRATGGSSIAGPRGRAADGRRRRGAASTATGRWITPGLIDCHTHLVYAGDRAHEFELRLAGATYEEIARAGGGIVSTVKATRAASEDELVGRQRCRGSTR